MKRKREEIKIIQLHPELELMTARQVCQLLHIGKAKLGQLVCAGKIAVYRLGHICRRFKREEIGAIGGKHG